MTRAQRDALEWLPADGGWRTDAGSISAALFRLRKASPGCVDIQRVPPSPGHGRRLRYRLTLTGQKLRQNVFTEA